MECGEFVSLDSEVFDSGGHNAGWDPQIRAVVYGIVLALAVGKGDAASR